MGKKICKIICVMLCALLFVSNMSIAASANENEDEAYVRRVRQELITGEVTDPVDVFKVVYEHLNADIDEDGMTAYIQEDGTLTVTQIVDNNNSRSVGSNVNIAVSSMRFVDDEGVPLTDYEYYYNELYETNYGQSSTYMVYVGHTAYYNVRTSGVAWSEIEVQLSYMVTTISYGTNAYTASKLEQSYGIYDTYPELDAHPAEGVKTRYSPSAGSYRYSPSSMEWIDPTSGNTGGGIYTLAEVSIANTNVVVLVYTELAFNSIDDDVFR